MAVRSFPIPVVHMGVVRRARGIVVVEGGSRTYTSAGAGDENDCLGSHDRECLSQSCSSKFRDVGRIVGIGK